MREAPAKRERTRAQLKAAVVRMLDRVEYQDLTITGIAKEAGVAVGTFYTHFPDLGTVLREVLEEFMVQEVQPGSPLSDAEDPFDSIRTAFLQIIRLVKAYPGLLRAMFAFKSRDPEGAALFERATERWVDALAEGARRYGPPQDIDERYYRFLGHATSAMVDEVLVRVFLQPFNALTALARTDEELAELLAVLRFRMLFGTNPDPARLTVGAPLARISLAAPETEEDR